MKKYIKKLVLIVIAVICISVTIIGISYLIEPSLYDFYTDIEITKEDRVLILSPHPDDEVIGTGGVIQKALNEGAKVSVVCLTNGDYNQLALILYLKKSAILKKSYIILGETRRQESIKGNETLGLNINDIIFLGYPDNGSLSIMLEYWDSKIPFRSILTRETRVPYKESYSPGASYIGESILNDLEKIIKDFSPTKIFVSSPVDLNNDHRALYLFLQIALWDLKDVIETPEVFTYLVHAKNWPQVNGYHPSKKITHPDFLDGDEIEWYKIDLTDEETLRKYKAISSYRSQIIYNPRFLVSFARTDEIFSKFAEINLEDSGSEDMEWYKCDVFRDGIGSLANTNFKDISYAINDKSLLIKINFHDKNAKNISGSIYLFGYKKEEDFAKMPKIHIKLGYTGFKVFSQKKQLINSGVELIYEGNDIDIKVPLSVLGEPTNVLSSVETIEAQVSDYAYDRFLWRVINLKY